MAPFLSLVLDLLVEIAHATVPADAPDRTVVVASVLADPDGDDVAFDAGEYVEV